MTESPETAKDVKEIKHRVKSIDNFQAFQLRAQKESVLSEIMDFFGNSKRKAEVFLEVNGEKSVSEIASNLDMKVPNVSKILSELEGLIELKETLDNKKIFKKRKQTKIIGLSSKIKSKFEI